MTNIQELQAILKQINSKAGTNYYVAIEVGDESVCCTLKNLSSGVHFSTDSIERMVDFFMNDLMY